MVTMVKVGNSVSQAAAMKIAAAVGKAMGAHYFKPEITVCPAYGSFDVYVTTQYEFVPEDGETPEFTLLSTITHALAYEASKAF